MPPFLKPYLFYETRINDDDSLTITRYRGYDKKVIIPERILGKPVTSIDNAFYGDIVEVIIPDSVTSIGHSAFDYCNLEKITIPESVTHIGKEAFAGCDLLTQITIPNSVTSIGASAFSRCGSLAQIAIPDSVETIGNEAFRDCKSLKTVIIPPSVTFIGENVFESCHEDLTVFTTPDSAASLYCEENSISWNCIFSNGPTYSNFETGFLMDETLAITGYSGSDEHVVVPAYINGTPVTHIHSIAFFTNGSVREITLPDTVRTIHSFAFVYNSNLERIHLPEGLRFIDMCAFAACPSLTEVNIPASVTDIRGNPFSMFKPQSVVLSPDNPRYSTRDSLILESGEETRLIGTFNTDSLPVIPQDVTAIGNMAFSICEQITAIVSSKEASTLSKKELKTTLILPDSITSIGYASFGHCDSLTTVSLPDSVVSIGSRAFSQCSMLTEVRIPSSVISISSDSFLDSPNLTLIVERGSYAEKYARNKKIAYQYAN